MRPSFWFFTLLVSMAALAGFTGRQVAAEHGRFAERKRVATESVRALGLTDLVLSTEARYTRHPAVSDKVVPFMNDPGALEHFPSGSFFFPVP